MNYFLKQKSYFKFLISVFVMMIMLVALLSCASNGECRHKYTQWEIITPVTCTGNGAQTRTCKKCGIIETNQIPATGHSLIVTEGKAVTCTQDGLTEGKRCQICNAVIAEQEVIPSSGHDYEEKIIEKATCSKNGEHELTCRVCHEHRKEKYSLKEYTPSEIYDNTVKSVGEVVTYDIRGNEIALGTCFVYSSDGQLITNFHVIDGAYSIKVELGEKTYNVRSIVMYDRDIDIAVMKIDETNLPFVTICKSEHAVGNHVYALGSSRGLTATFSQGIITHSLREMDDVIYVQHDAAISKGNSGGPLINQFGEVIGINTLTYKDSQNLNFAISMKELENLSQQNELSMLEFYEKECDAFIKMKNYIQKKGSYDYTTKEYTAVLDTSYSDDKETKFVYMVCYNTTKDNIKIYFYMETIYGKKYTIYFTFEDFNGIYDYSYYDYYGYRMSGTVKATDVRRNFTLKYSYSNIYHTSLQRSVLGLASIMAENLCTGLNVFFKDINLRAADLGFTNI